MNQFYQQPYYGMGMPQMGQQQMNDLYRQRDLIDQRINQFQQPNIQPQMSQNVFETRKVTNEEEAKRYINTVTSQPLLLFEEDAEIFYMVSNGTLQKFSYARIDEQAQIGSLEQRVNELTENVKLILSYIDQGGLNNAKSIQPSAE